MVLVSFASYDKFIKAVYAGIILTHSEYSASMFKGTPMPTYGFSPSGRSVCPLLKGCCMNCSMKGSMWGTETYARVS